MTFSKIPVGGEQEMLHLAMEAKLKESPSPTRDVRLPFLFPPADGGLNETLRDCIEAKGNFRLKLPTGFTLTPERKSISKWAYGCCFQGRNENEWAYVEHMIVSDDHLNDRIEGWVEAAVMLTKKPLIHPHAQVCRDFELVQFMRVPAICRDWMKRHRADAMASWVGTIRRHGANCRMFVACMRRGRESWLVEYVFPSVASTNENRESVDRAEMRKAGLVFGNFGICDVVQTEDIQ